MGFSISVPLWKVDETLGLVYGRATQEIEDKAGEIMDYDSSKAFFQSWSDETAKRTKGKSFGNVRIQHDSKRVGGKIAEPLSFNDDDKAIDVCIKVTDKNLFEDIKAGVYSGLSIGGSYEKKWTDENGKQRYTARPSELSIVDNPAVETAVIEYIKADGTVEHRTLAKEDKPMDELSKVNDEVLKDFQDALAKADSKKAFSFEEITNRLMGALKAQITTPFNAGYFWIKKTYPDSVIICGDLDGDGDKDCYRVGYSMDADGIITLGKIEAVRAVWVPAIDEDNPAQEFGLPKARKADEAGELQKADGEADEKARDEEAVEKRDFSAEERRKLADEGKAMPDGSFPIENKEDLKNAIRLAGHAKDKKAAIEFICRRARALGAEDFIPDDWKTKEKAEVGEMEKAETIEKMDVFEAVSKAMDSEDDKDLKEKCGKLFHKMVEKKLYCSCDKCSKAVEESVKKAEEPADLNKADGESETMQKDVHADELAKAVSMIEDLKKGFDALKADNDALKKQVEKLENEPLPGGAMVAAGTAPMEKSIGDIAGTIPMANSEADMLRKMRDEADSSLLKQAYSERLAQIEMKKIYEGL